MSPHDIIRSALERVMNIYDADDLADEILAALASAAMVVVPAEAVINVQKPCKCGSADA
jgi:hypothetical protein